MSQKSENGLRGLYEDFAVLEEKTSAQLQAYTEQLADETVLSPEERETLHRQIASDLQDYRPWRKRLRTFLSRSNVAADEVRTRLREIERLEKRRFRVLPKAPTNAAIDLEERERRHFAQGLTFYKLFWVFFMGCFFGVIIEMLWHLINSGLIESRAGLVYGPFNLVYGFGALALTLALYRFRNHSKIYAFFGGFVIGSAVEYVCSWVQEMLFGSTSWDYSNMPFNMNGRICLLYAVFWGLLGILWIKELYPRMVKLILKISNKVGKTLTWILLVFMLINTVVSCGAVLRWEQRLAGSPPENGYEAFMDRRFPDSRMERIYANMEFGD